MNLEIKKISLDAVRRETDRHQSQAADPSASAWVKANAGTGKTHVLMDVKGPGVITHMWLTFLGPEIQEWARNGSATHQEMLLRIYWDGSKRPGIEAPVGDFFANCFGKRSEVISLPVVVRMAMF